jgi:hypothetical protein
MTSNTVDHIIELPEDPLGGTAGAKMFRVLFAGKTSSDKFPYIVFNEKVAGEIGRVLGLHCPEVLMEPFDDRWYFFSHWQETTTQGTILPPGTSKEIADFFEENPEYIHGMIIFDLYVGNNDRRRDNIILRRDRKLALIDQGNALLYYRASNGNASFGLERLKKLRSDMRAMFDKPYRFLKALTDMTLVEIWTEKIRQIPDYFLESVIQNLPEMEYIDKAIKENTTEFLLNRRGYLLDHIIGNRVLFPNLGEGGKKNGN